MKYAIKTLHFKLTSDHSCEVYVHLKSTNDHSCEVCQSRKLGVIS